MLFLYTTAVGFALGLFFYGFLLNISPKGEENALFTEKNISVISPTFLQHLS